MVPDEVLQGLMDRAVRDDLVDTVAGAAQREAQVVCHPQQLPKVHSCGSTPISTRAVPISEANTSHRRPDHTL